MRRDRPHTGWEPASVSPFLLGANARSERRGESRPRHRSPRRVSRGRRERSSYLLTKSSPASGGEDSQAQPSRWTGMREQWRPANE